MFEDKDEIRMTDMQIGDMKEVEGGTIAKGYVVYMEAVITDVFKVPDDVEDIMHPDTRTLLALEIKTADDNEITLLFDENHVRNLYEVVHSYRDIWEAKQHEIHGHEGHDHSNANRMLETLRELLEVLEKDEDD